MKNSNPVCQDALIFGNKPSSSETNQLIEELLQQGLTLRVRVTGQSMRPCIDSHDTVTIARAEPRQLKKGDLVLFKSNSNRLILHRVIRISQSVDRGYTFFTRGDACNVFDTSFGKSALLGRVLKIQKSIPLVGFGTIDLTAPSGRLFNYIIFLSNLPRGKAFARIKSGIKRIANRLMTESQSGVHAKNK